MISWFDMPSQGLSGGGEFEIRELTATENKVYETPGEVYNKVTVNVEGGGSSWQTVFEGSVTTVDDDGDIFGIIEDLTLTGDSVKASLNGIEYILPKTEHGYGAENESGLDFSTYPLFIAVGEGFCNLWTPTAGTYTLKIEEEQSGSSDFSTAEVTMVIGDNVHGDIYLPNIDNDVIYSTARLSTGIVSAVLYKGEASGLLEDGTGLSITTSGDVVYNAEDFAFIITGDCTITIS